MARTITLANLRSLIQWQADIAGLTLRHTSASLTTAINSSIQRFREWISDNGFQYYLTHKTGTLGTGATSPHVFYELDMTAFSPTVVRVYGFDVEVNGERHQLDPIDFRDRNAFQDRNNANGIPVAFTMYNDVKLALLPPPGSPYTYVLYYLPVAADLSGESDTFDGKAGWEWWIVWDVFHSILHRDANPELLASVKMERDKIQESILRRSRSLQRVGPMGKRDTRGETRTKRLFAGRTWLR